MAQSFGTMCAKMDRLEKFFSGQMEEGGFTVAKSKTQKKKEKRELAAMGSTAAPATSGSLQPKAEQGEDQHQEDDHDETMEDDAAVEQPTTKERMERCQSVVQRLEESSKEEPDDKAIAQLLEAKRLQLQQLQAQALQEAADRKPAWSPLREVATKCEKKKKALGKAKTNLKELEDKHVEWTLQKEVEERQMLEEISQAKDNANKLEQELAALEAEHSGAVGRLRLGQGEAPAVKSITACLLEIKGQPSHEVQLALNSAQAMLVNGLAAEKARVQAAKSDGTADLPADEAASRDEASAREQVVEHTRQLHLNAETFIKHQNELQEKQRNASRHLACLQKARTTAAAAVLGGATTVQPVDGNGGDVGGPSAPQVQATAMEATGPAGPVDNGQQLRTASAIPVPP